MAYLAVDKNRTEWIGDSCPDRYEDFGWWFFYGNHVELPKGSIAKLIGRKLTWKDEPVEIGTI